MPTTVHFVENLKRIDRIIKNRTAGLTHEQSLLQLGFPANCLNWNLGHLLVYRQKILGVIDGVSQPDPAEFAIYGAGSEPLTDGTRALPLPVLLDRLQAISDKIVFALEAMPAARLAEVFDHEDGSTVDDDLFFYLVFHESYHAGQLEILQELALAHS